MRGVGERILQNGKSQGKREICVQEITEALGSLLFVKLVLLSRTLHLIGIL